MADGQRPARLSEAQRIVDELVTQFGLAGAAIAREIGVKPDTIGNIRGRRATGNLQLHRLRILRDSLASAAQTANTPSTAEHPAASVAQAVPSVAEMLSGVTAGDEPARLAVNADEPTPDAPKKISERAGDWLRAAMLGDSGASPTSAKSPGMGAPASRGKASAGDVREDFVAQVVPLAAFVMILGADFAIHDPYKPCAPTHAEASAMLYPLIKRMARELDIRHALTEGSMEVLAELVSIGAYGNRAWHTYRAIRAFETEGLRDDEQARQSSYAAAYAAGAGGANAGSVDASGSAGSGAATPPLYYADSGGVGHRSESRFAARRGRSSVARASNGKPGADVANNGHSEDRRQGDALIDALLNADADGRRRLGL